MTFVAPTSSFDTLARRADRRPVPVGFSSGGVRHQEHRLLVDGKIGMTPGAGPAADSAEVVAGEARPAVEDIGRVQRSPRPTSR